MKVARAGVVYMVANVVSSGIPLLLLPLLSRVLSPTEYGEVVIFQMIIAASSALSGLSVHAALGVAWFKHNQTDFPRLVGSALVVAATSTVFFAAVAALLFHASGTEVFGISAFWGAIAVATAGFNVVLQCRLVLWQSQQRPFPMAILQMAASGLNVGLSLFFVLILGWGAVGRNAGIAFSALLMAGTALALLFYFKQAALCFRSSDVRLLFGFGLSLIPHALAGLLIATADRYIVSANFGATELGVYGAAAQLGSMMLVLGDAFGKAFNPWVFQRMATMEDKDALEVVGAMYLTIPGFLLIALVLGICIWLAVPVLLGPAYRSATDFLPLFLLGGAFSGMYLAVSGLYFFSGRTALLSGVTMTVALLGTLVTSVLVPKFGLYGAAFGYAGMQALLALGAWIVARRVFSLPWAKLNESVFAWWQLARKNGR